jgi:hypothetical protein
LAKQDDVFIPLLEKASDYRVSVLKFSFPSENETFIIDNPADYKIIYSINVHHSGSNDLRKVEYPLFSNAAFKMNNINDMIENFNRTSIRCHRDLLNDITDIYGSYNALSGQTIKTAKKTVNVSGNTSSQELQNAVVRTLDFSTDINNDSFAASIEVVAQFSSTNPTPIPLCLTMTLSDNLQNKVVIFANKIVNNNQTYVFSDGSINPQSTTLSLQEYIPVEPMNKIIRDAISSQRGNWTLTITNRMQGVPYNYNVSVKVMFSPHINEPFQTTDVFYPRIAPGCYYNQQTRSVSLLYDENIHQSGFNIELSPKLYNIMPFDGIRQANGNYILEIPQDILSDEKTLKINTYEPADNYSNYKMIDLQSIILKTTLPVSGEFQSDSIDRILMSLDISSTDLNSSFFEFVNNSIASRSYQLLSDLPLRQIGISVFLKYRSTGAIIPARLPAFTTFSMLLKFIPNDANF